MLVNLLLLCSQPTPIIHLLLLVNYYENINLGFIKGEKDRSKMKLGT